MSWPMSWTGPAWQTALAQSNRGSRVDSGPGALPSSRKLRRIEASVARRERKKVRLSMGQLPNDSLIVSNCHSCGRDTCGPLADRRVRFVSGERVMEADVCASCAKAIERHYGRRLEEMAT